MLSHNVRVYVALKQHSGLLPNWYTERMVYRTRTSRNHFYSQRKRVRSMLNTDLPLSLLVPLKSAGGQKIQTEWWAHLAYKSNFCQKLVPA